MQFVFGAKLVHDIIASILTGWFATRLQVGDLSLKHSLRSSLDRQGEAREPENLRRHDHTVKSELIRNVQVHPPDDSSDKITCGESYLIHLSCFLCYSSPVVLISFSPAPSNAVEASTASASSRDTSRGCPMSAPSSFIHKINTPVLQLNHVPNSFTI